MNILSRTGGPGKIARDGAVILAIACFWIVTASAGFCLIIGWQHPGVLQGGRLDLFVFPFMQWFEGLPLWSTLPWARAYLTLSGAVPSVAIVVVGGALTRRSVRIRRHLTDPMLQEGPLNIERGVTDNHGHAEWREMESAQELFPGPDPVHGGIVVGEAYRVDHDNTAGPRFLPDDASTWAMGGKAPLLIDPCTTGAPTTMVIAGPGGYKSSSAVSTILHWTGSSVVLDPSTELGPMLDAALRAQHKDVVHIGIPSGEGSVAVGINVLGWIDVEDPEAEVHIRTVAGWIYDEDTAGRVSRSDDPFFAPMGRELVTCLLAHVVYDAPPEDRTLATFAVGMAIAEDEMLAVLTGIQATSKSPLAKRLAAPLMRCKAEETWSGVFMNAVKSTAWLFTAAYADMVSDSSFDPRALLEGGTTVFLNLGLRTLDNTPALARVLVGALLNTVYEADGATKGCVLFLLDEAARLGRLKALETARDTGRKYNVRLHMLLQSTGQLLDIWGREGARSWIDGAAWIGYAAIRAGGAGRDLSEQLGTYAVRAYSEGDNQGRNKPGGFAHGTRSTGSNVNVHEIKRALMSPAELQTDLREDEIIIVPATGMPLRIGRAIYFRRQEMTAQVTPSKFATAAE